MDADGRDARGTGQKQSLGRRIEGRLKEGGVKNQDEPSPGRFKRRLGIGRMRDGTGARQALFPCASLQEMGVTEQSGKLSCDVAVIGAGTAGLAAERAAVTCTERPTR